VRDVVLPEVCAGACLASSARALADETLAAWQQFKSAAKAAQRAP